MSKMCTGATSQQVLRVRSKHANTVPKINGQRLCVCVYSIAMIGR